MALRSVYLAGGCFWGTERYLSLIPGVVSTMVGYANGDSPNPSYEAVCHGSGHAETVKVDYDDCRISLTFLLERFFESIDPTTINRQGADTGIQYRTGIYFTGEADRNTALEALAQLQKRYAKTVTVEVMPLMTFYDAETYHQKYLDKNPNGYCHIRPGLFDAARAAVDKETISRFND